MSNITYSRRSHATPLNHNMSCGTNRDQDITHSTISSCLTTERWGTCSVSHPNTYRLPRQHSWRQYSFIDLLFISLFKSKYHLKKKVLRSKTDENGRQVRVLMSRIFYLSPSDGWRMWGLDEPIRVLSTVVGVFPLSLTSSCQVFWKKSHSEDLRKRKHVDSDRTVV
jgi:hypothetical protein